MERGLGVECAKDSRVKMGTTVQCRHVANVRNSDIAIEVIVN